LKRIESLRCKVWLMKISLSFQQETTKSDNNTTEPMSAFSKVALMRVRFLWSQLVCYSSKSNKMRCSDCWETYSWQRTTWPHGGRKLIMWRVWRTQFQKSNFNRLPI
jgi:hypothetical protein